MVRKKIPIELLEIRKASTPQHSDEISASVTVTKVEKRCWMVQDENSKRCKNRKSAAKLRIGEGSTTKRPQARDCGGCPTTEWGEDIVCALVKASGREIDRRG